MVLPRRKRRRQSTEASPCELPRRMGRRAWGRVSRSVAKRFEKPELWSERLTALFPECKFTPYTGPLHPDCRDGLVAFDDLW